MSEANTVIPLGGINSLLKVYESIGKGEMVGILGDRIAGNDKFVSCRFLNKDAQFPTGPILLAASLKAPVILIFGLYKGGNRYDIYFELFFWENSLYLPHPARNHDSFSLSAPSVVLRPHFPSSVPCCRC